MLARGPMLGRVGGGIVRGRGVVVATGLGERLLDVRAPPPTPWRWGVRLLSGVPRAPSPSGVEL